MAGVFKLDITETVDELKTLLGQQKTAFGKERVQALYLLNPLLSVSEINK